MPVAHAARRASASQRRSTQRRRKAPSARDAWSLASFRNVPGVEHDEHVQQSGNDDEGVAVLIGDGHNAAGTVSEKLGDEIRRPDAEIRDRGKADERLREIECERKDPSLQPQPGREHQRQRNEEDEALLPAAQQNMTRARYRPRERGYQVLVGGGLDLIRRGGAHYS